MVACPCGIGLAAPTAQLVGVGLAARRGILLKGGEAFQAVRKATVIVFDKTGTLTTSSFAVSDSHVTSAVDEKTLLAMVCAVESTSAHPLAAGLTRHCAEKLGGSTEPSVKVEKSEEIAGRGIVASIVLGDDQRNQLTIGNFKLAKDDGVEFSADQLQEIERWQGEGKSVVFVTSPTSSLKDSDTSSARAQLLAYFALHDPPRAEASFVIKQLGQRQIDAWMASGDNERTAIAVAGLIGIPADRVLAGALPTDKQALIKRLQGEGQVVAFVGDGINGAFVCLCRS